MELTKWALDNEVHYKFGQIQKALCEIRWLFRNVFNSLYFLNTGLEASPISL